MKDLIVTRDISNTRLAIYFILTVLLWCLFAYYLRNVPFAIIEAINQDGTHNQSPELIAMISTLKIIGGFIVYIFGIALIFGCWSLFNFHAYHRSKKPLDPVEISPEEMAAYFHTSPDIINAMRNERIQTVDFNHDGHLTLSKTE